MTYLLDPELHTFGERLCLITLRLRSEDQRPHAIPSDRLRYRSAFLFSILIVKALKFTPSFPNHAAVYKSCHRATEHLLLASLMSNTWSNETIQSILIMTDFQEPIDDRSYLLLGIVSLLNLCSAS